MDTHKKLPGCFIALLWKTGGIHILNLGPAVIVIGSVATVDAPFFPVAFRISAGIATGGQCIGLENRCISCGEDHRGFVVAKVRAPF